MSIEATESAIGLLTGGSQLHFEPSSSSGSANLDILEQLGLTVENIEFASKLHGSTDVFYREVGYLLALQDEEELDTGSFQDLLALLQNGYTLGQAQAAICTAQVMDLNISELCSAKILELENASEEDNIDDIEDSSIYDDTAIKLGVPKIPSHPMPLVQFPIPQSKFSKSPLVTQDLI